MRILAHIVICVSFFLIFPPAVLAASFYFSPASGTYSPGANFSVAVLINSKDVTINAGEGVIRFDPACLTVREISKTGSIFTLWSAKPGFLNSSGRITFAGGLANPGFNGSSGKVFTINFRAEAPCTAAVAFSSGAILANDSQGTNVLDNSGTGAYNIAPTTQVSQESTSSDGSPAGQRPPAAQIFSTTHPDQNKWYNSTEVIFSWGLPPGITGASFILDQTPETDPVNISQEIYAVKNYSGIGEGIWYFHLKLENTYGWSPASHYRIQIDLTPPPVLEVTLVDDTLISGLQPGIYITAQDALSGIDYFEAKVGSGSPLIIKPEDLPSNIFKAPIQNPGLYPFSVKAYDKAGNFIEQEIELIINSIGRLLINTFIRYYWLLAIIILLVVFICWLLFYGKKKKIKLRKELSDVEKKLLAGLEALKTSAKMEDGSQKTPSGRKTSANTHFVEDIEEIKEDIIKEIEDVEKAIK